MHSDARKLDTKPTTLCTSITRLAEKRMINLEYADLNRHGALGSMNLTILNGLGRLLSKVFRASLEINPLVVPRVAVDPDSGLGVSVIWGGVWELIPRNLRSTLPNCNAKMRPLGAIDWAPDAAKWPIILSQPALAIGVCAWQGNTPDAARRSPR